MGELSERFRFGFEKIDRDLSYLMDHFAAVLNGVGDSTVAEQLPWQQLGSNASASEAIKPLDNARVQAFSISFQLLNMVEENVANQVRRMVERSEGSLVESGLWGNYLSRLREEGWQPEVIAEALPHVRVEPVFTAHPTESKRITVLEQHRELYLQLVKRENTMWTPAEQREIDRQVQVALERLWRTGETLLEKPTVAAERNALLHYLVNVLPEALRVADLHLLEAWEAVGWDVELIEDPALWPRLRFGTWVGGDRDGHPLVTPTVTRETFRALRTHALTLQKTQLHRLLAKLSLSSHLRPPPPRLEQQLQHLGSLVTTEEFTAVRERNPGEPWRQVVALMLLRLPPVEAEVLHSAPVNERFYKFAYELSRDLRVLRDCLIEAGAKAIAKADLDPILRTIEVFGFHMAALDVRQNSGFHDKAIEQILARAGLSDTDYGTWPEQRKLEFFNRELERLEPLVGVEDLTGIEARAAVGALRELAVQRKSFGEEGIGSIILSMTRTTADLLAVYFLAREAGLFAVTDEGTVCTIPLAPLLETIDDLENGPAILSAFLDHPVTQRSLRYARRRHGKMIKKGKNLHSPDFYQQVMIGYSDSNKDSGIVAAQWALNKAQRLISEIAVERGLRVRFFHGRGGTVSRGAGPTHRFLEALPAESAAFDLRLTEQGEVIAQKYANLLTASYNLDLLLAGTFYHSFTNSRKPRGRHQAEPVMERLATSSRKAYRGLLQADGFMRFYRQATPIDALEMSRIGSRPARRTGAQTLADLRAIPWVFSWSQSRFFLPGWFGTGTALRELREQHPADWTLLQASLGDWPFLRYALTNIETALMSADPVLMKAYGSLVEEDTLRDEILTLILEEYHATQTHLTELLGTANKQRRPRLEKTLMPRSSALQPLHHHQIALLRQWRSVERDSSRSETILQDLLLTINAIAAGLRTTG